MNQPAADTIEEYFLEIHPTLILMAATAGALVPETLMALDAGKGKDFGPDLMIEA
jgi:hypothetical protein